MPPDSGAVSSLARNLATASQRPSGDQERCPPAGNSSSRRSEPPRGDTRWIEPACPRETHRAATAGTRSASRPETRREEVVRGTGREPPAFGLPDDPQPDVVVTSPLSRCRKRDLAAVGENEPVSACRTNVSWTSRGVGPSRGRRYPRAAAAMTTRTTPTPPAASLRRRDRAAAPRRPAPRPANRTPPSSPAARPSRRACSGTAAPAPCAGSAG